MFASSPLARRSHAARSVRAVDEAPTSSEQTSVAAGLTRILDDTRALEAKTRRFLRDLPGPVFVPLRSLLEEQSSDLKLAAERIADRMLTLGLAPRRRGPSSPSSVHRGAVWTAEEMLGCLVREHELLARRTVGVLRVTARASDDATIDLLRWRIEEHEAAAWALVALGAAELFHERARIEER
jgi:starvation-inducible DNA-binding protein